MTKLPVAAARAAILALWASILLFCTFAGSRTFGASLGFRTFETTLQVAHGIDDGSGGGNTCLLVSESERTPHPLVHPGGEVVVRRKPLIQVRDISRGEIDPYYRGASLDRIPKEEVKLLGTDVEEIREKMKDLCPGGVVEKYPGTPGLVFRSTGGASETSVGGMRGVQQPLKEPGLGEPWFPPQIPLPVPPPLEEPDETRWLHVDFDALALYNIMIFGDGYTLTEREKFFTDAQVLADSISTTGPFSDTAPLVNIWAAFYPSAEGGIGVGGTPKNTTFGLYRDGTELRGVYVGKRENAVAACIYNWWHCNIALLLGNDPLYGGLGGEFTITTASRNNGANVLRHELGHSILEVGEEYDGGFAYFGVNADSISNSSVGWSHWLADPEDLRVERAVMPLQGYPWTYLRQNESFSQDFNSSGTYTSHLVRFSLSGIPEADQLEVSLDGVTLPWKPKHGIGIDRWHYDIYRNFSLSEGAHTLKFDLGPSGNESIAQLCSYEILEFGDEKEFNTTTGHISLYPTFSFENETTYRPTNEQCLMRDVTSERFCSPCKEELWKAIISRSWLLHSIGGRCHPPDEHSDEAHMGMEINSVALGQFNPYPRPDEYLTFNWSFQGEHLEEFDNMTMIPIGNERAGRAFELNITFYTPEVKLDPESVLSQRFYLGFVGSCAMGLEDSVEPFVSPYPVDRKG